MIVNVRGTNGSGKSTAVRMFIESIGGFDKLKPIYVEKRRKPLYYVHEWYNFALLGHYESACGGLDNIEYKQTFPLTQTLVKEEGMNVLLESMLMSFDMKWFRKMKEEVDDDLRILYLSTSVEQCLKNIEKRRLESGRTYPKPVNVKMLKDNYDNTAVTRPRLEDAGVRCNLVSVHQAARVMKRWLCSERDQPCER